MPVILNRFRTLLLSLFILIPIFGFGQTGKRDVVYLKNGSIIRGVIIADSAMVKIETSDHSVWAFNRAEVDSIKKEDKPRYTGLKTPQKGYYNVSVIGANIPSPDLSTTSGLSLSMTNGYRLCPYFSIGGVVGLDMFEKDIYMPASLECRGEIIRRGATPFWFAQYGYPLIKNVKSDEKIYNAGRSFTAGGGILFVLNSNIALVAQLSYKAQKSTYVRYRLIEGEYIETVDYRRTCLQVGLQF
jgi:hypothetical protein